MLVLLALIHSDHARIYATPSNILRSAGSVGVALIMWLIGSLIAALGTTVYIELGTVSKLHS